MVTIVCRGRRRRRRRAWRLGCVIVGLLGVVWGTAADGEVNAALVGLVGLCGVPEPLDHAFFFLPTFG